MGKNWKINKLMEKMQILPPKIEIKIGIKVKKRKKKYKF